MKQAFPYKTIIGIGLFAIFLVLGFFSSVLYFRVFPKIKKRNEVMDAYRKEEEQKALKRQTNEFLRYNLYGKYKRLKPQDERRFFDCRWKAEDVIPQPFYAYPYLNFFNNDEKDTNSFTGVAVINNWPSLIHAHNLNNYNHNKSRVLIGIRGSDYGIHKSNLPMEMLNLMKRNENFKDDLMLLPDNYVFIHPDQTDIGSSPIQAACHNRTYEGERYVGNTWDFFDKGAFWDTYDELFTNELYKTNQDVFIFAYSNGSSPRYQLMKSKKIDKCDDDGTIEGFEKCHEFIDERAFRIKAILDLETNYDYVNLKNTAMFVDKNIRGKEGRYYYAICASKDCPISNHEELIRLLKLKPKPIKTGFVRYQDDTGRIVVDMINHHGPILISHSSVIPFGIKEFEDITLKEKH